ncbi:ABC transporter permease [Hyalangium minutum]|uniref:ABC-type nitrate/sulfonate/bicarbonate transport system, permease component n=1 Tax=Hyalangium minutum TaxID=394096 RepID=A0A085WB11_9BACT|nr:ABC transporter permease [Hyalangium minutum]KFE64874.1 ABC-type nitrate/sulfonate/bicarbonate transport system, permease component [Hyalangium minutum]
MIEPLARGLSLVTTRCACEYLEELRALDELSAEMSLSGLTQNRVSMHFASSRWLLPLLAAAVMLLCWGAGSALGLLPVTAVPSPSAVLQCFQEELLSGRLLRDIVASLFRVAVGLSLATALAVPLGLGLGHYRPLREALLPTVNFLRSLSPLAWIPFAILWFGIGDASSIFLIFLAAFCPLAISVAAAVANVPAVYFRLGREYGWSGPSLLLRVTLPAITPQLITALRVAAGISWVVVVAAEMIAGRDGLGFMIWDARNGLRTDLLVCGMIVIGLIGVLLDQALFQLSTFPSVRWGYER